MFTNTERLALAGFLAGYSGLTREAYELDLRQYTSWCHQHHLRLFQARRADIECFALGTTEDPAGPGHGSDGETHLLKEVALDGAATAAPPPVPSAPVQSLEVLAVARNLGPSPCVIDSRRR